MAKTKKGPIRVALLGAGGIACGAHLPGYKALGGLVEVVAACDPNPARLKEAEEKHGICWCSPTPQEILKREEIDAVSVCAGNKFHAPLTIAALKAGKHVLVEKPMAMNAVEARAMVEASKKAGKILMVGVNQRFRGDVAVLKEMIERGDFGPIRLVKTGWVRRRGIPGLGTWFTNKSLSGGGPLIDLGVHMIDLGWYLMGCPRPLTVSGMTCDDIGPGFGKERGGLVDTEDMSAGMVRFAGNSILQFEVSWAENVENEHGFLEIYGSRAGAILENPLRVFTEVSGRQVNMKIDTPKINGHQEEIRYFIDCVRNNKPPTKSPAEHGVEIMKILDGIYKSAATAHEVILNK